MLKVIIFFVYLNKNKHFVSQLKINGGKALQGIISLKNCKPMILMDTILQHYSYHPAILNYQCFSPLTG